MTLSDYGELPDCMLCHDAGLIGGADTPFDYCRCALGERKRIEEPDLVPSANRGRALIEARFGARQGRMPK